MCRTPALSVSGPGALCIGPQRSLRRAACYPIRYTGFVPPIRPRASSSKLHAAHPVCPQLGAACHPSGPQAPKLNAACPPSSPGRSLFPGENPEPYCLGNNYKGLASVELTDASVTKLLPGRCQLLHSAPDIRSSLSFASRRRVFPVFTNSTCRLIPYPFLVALFWAKDPITIRTATLNRGMV